MTLFDPNFQKAVNGWKQAVGLLRPLVDGLEFAIAEMDKAAKDNPNVFPKDTGNAVRYAEAQSALNIAKLYLKSMDSP